MGALIAIALRNVLRNRRRSLLTGGAVLIGVAVIVFLKGFVNGFVDEVSLAVAEGVSGAIQVHRSGFRQAQSGRLLLDMAQDEALLAKIRAVPGVRAVAPRITFEGLLGNGLRSTMVLVTALDPVVELEVCPRRWRNASVRGLPREDRSAAMLGPTLAAGLGAGPGATLTLTSSTRAGASNALDLSVQELMGTTSVLDSKRAVTISLAHAQELLGMQGRVTEYAIAVERLRDAAPISRALRQALGEGYDVQSWLEVLPQIAVAVDLVDGIMAFIILVLFALVGAGIVNTMLMSVYERVREIGTMQAVGVKRRQLLGMFLVEAAGLGAAGGLGGAALGTVVVLWLGASGIPFRPAGAETKTLLVQPWVDTSFVALTVAVAALGALVAAIYPAWRASRLTPVEALRSL